MNLLPICSVVIDYPESEISFTLEQNLAKCIIFCIAAMQYDLGAYDEYLELYLCRGKT